MGFIADLLQRIITVTRTSVILCLWMTMPGLGLSYSVDTAHADIINFQNGWIGFANGSGGDHYTQYRAGTLSQWCVSIGLITPINGGPDSEHCVCADKNRLGSDDGLGRAVFVALPAAPCGTAAAGSTSRLVYRLVKTKITRNVLGQAPHESEADGFQGALDVRSAGPGFEFVVTFSADVPKVVNELGERFTASARARSQFSLGGVTSNINTAVSVAGQGVHEALPKPDQPWLQPGSYALEANHSVDMNLGDWTRTVVENGVEHREFTVNFHGGVVQSISGGSLTFVYRREESGGTPTGTAVVPGGQLPGGMQHLVLQGLGQTANLRRTGWDSWTWAENSAVFNFRAVSNTPPELVIVDTSRDMYHRLNLVTGETWWRQGQNGNWNPHYRIVAVDGAVR